MSAHTGVVIGVGNANRGDDGLGPMVARRLRKLAPDEVAVIAHRGDAAGLVERFSHVEFAVLVDAAAPMGGAGTIHRFDAAAGPLPAAAFGGSTHGFGVPEAIELARALGRLPAHCVVFAVEGRDFEPGAPLSAAVSAAVAPAALRVLGEIRGLVDAGNAATRGKRNRSRREPGAGRGG